MKNLIDLRTYVLEQKTPHKLDKIEAFDNIKNYAKFLSMPLELKMFLPVDDEGNFLEEPVENDFKDSTGFISNVFFIEMTEYKKALSEVIFEGFEVKSKTAFNNGYEFVVDKNEIFYPYWKNPVLGWELSKGLRNIEDLIKFNLTLTDNAIAKHKL